MSAERGRKRTAARLAAVQALYQMELTGESSRDVIVEFTLHRLKGDIADEGFGEADRQFFDDLTAGASAHRDDLDRAISAALTPDWPLARLQAVLRAILRCGAFELAHRRDVPPQATISEYLDIAHAFFAGKEPGLVNGVLDKLARDIRREEMEEPRRGGEPAAR